jgi:hypothetical protein
LLSAVSEEISVVTRREHPRTRVDFSVLRRRNAQISCPVIHLKMELNPSVLVMGFSELIIDTRME